MIILLFDSHLGSIDHNNYNYRISCKRLHLRHHFLRMTWMIFSMWSQTILKCLGCHSHRHRRRHRCCIARMNVRLAAASTVDGCMSPTNQHIKTIIDSIHAVQASRIHQIHDVYYVLCTRQRVNHCVKWFIYVCTMHFRGTLTYTKKKKMLRQNGIRTKKSNKLISWASSTSKSISFSLFFLMNYSKQNRK